jgi:hypothetical protein
MARHNKAERVMGLDGKTRAAIEVLHAGNDDLVHYLRVEGNAVRVRDYTFAGSGAAFLIDAFISLWSGRPQDAVNLYRISDLDESNRQLFLDALRAYMDA